MFCKVKLFNFDLEKKNNKIVLFILSYTDELLFPLKEYISERFLPLKQQVIKLDKVIHGDPSVGPNCHHLCEQTGQISLLVYNHDKVRQ